MRKEEEEEEEEEYDDSEYQATDIDSFDEDSTETKPSDSAFSIPETLSLNLSYKSLIFIMMGLHAFSTVAIIAMALMTSRRFEKVEHQLHHTGSDIESLSKAISEFTNTNRPQVCESCKNEKEKERPNPVVDDWISMMKERAKTEDDIQNQKIPSKYSVVDFPNLSINDIYHIKRDMSGRVVDVKKHGSYVR